MMHGRHDNHGKSPRIRLAALCLLFGLLGAAGADAALTAQVAVESRDVFLGEPFTMQIEVRAEAEVQPPDLSGLRDFKVEDLGPRTSSSTRITMINGKVIRKVDRRTVFAYRLIPTRTGTLRIPAITIRAGGERTATRPVVVRVSAPRPVEDIRLEAELSRSECYVGEAVTVRWKWLVGREVRGFQFYIPLLEQNGFTVPDQKVEIDQRRRDRYVRIPLVNGDDMIGMKSYQRRNGRGFTVVTFSRVLIPTAPGTYRLSPGTVTCEVFAGMQPARRNNSFFFDDFFGGPRKRYRQTTVAARPLTLKVKPLPAKGRPANFSGIVGQVRIEASADPVEVSVGEPIILTITLSGPEYLDNVQLPPLGRQADLAAGFKISDEDPGKIEGDKKVFQRTLRAIRADVKAIPPIRIAYFDSAAGTYAEAASRPIPLVVHPTRVVTALDAEGSGPAAAAGKTLKAWTRGLAHNYEDLGVLENQDYGLDAWLRSPAWLAALAGFPGIYLALVIGLALRRRNLADSEGRRARKAAGRFRRDLAGVTAASSDREALERLLEALREYLGAKFAVSPGALLFPDIDPRLAEAGVDPDVRNRLGRLFERCEAGRYAGGADPIPRDALVKEARDLIAALEKTLK